MIDLRRLALLRELHHRGTIAAVAAALSYSSSSVSQQLSQLEREVGVPLLVKSGRRVRLTPAAELLVSHTGDVLERMEALEAALAATGDAVAGTVRLAVFQSAALGIVPQALTLFADEYPALRVEITQREPESALAAVWAREFDLVIAEQYPGHAAPRLAELDREPLCGDELRLAARDTGDRRDRGRARGGLGDGAAGDRIPALGGAALPGRGLRARRALRDRGPAGAHPAGRVGARGRAAAGPGVGRRRPERAARRPAGTPAARGVHLGAPRERRRRDDRRLPRRARPRRRAARPRLIRQPPPPFGPGSPLNADRPLDP